MSLKELRAALTRRRLSVGYGKLWRFSIGDPWARHWAGRQWGTLDAQKKVILYWPMECVLLGIDKAFDANSVQNFWETGC